MGADYQQGYHIHRPEPLPHWEVSRLYSDLPPPRKQDHSHNLSPTVGSLDDRVLRFR
jgi:hypothetical protein